MTKILLVEDEPAIRDMVDRRLRKKNFDVVVAVDGLDACSKAQSEQPDVILMDMGLPQLDGLEATQRLKQAPDTRAIPIIALTALAMAGDRERALQAGCDDYETKPIDFPGLLKKIERLLQGKAGS